MASNRFLYLTPSPALLNYVKKKETISPRIVIRRKWWHNKNRIEQKLMAAKEKGANSICAPLLTRRTQQLTYGTVLDEIELIIDIQAKYHCVRLYH